MVAKITTPSTIHTALNYNEKKVVQGKAECLHAAGYLREANEMNFYQKLEGFERLNKLNDRATTKTLHISLNFDPSEKITNDKLVAIANDYMNKIGFGKQPYLIYKHKDAGHPHIHIVTTTIQADSKRINTHNIGRNQSEKARKEIEQSYQLIRAEDQKRLTKNVIKPVNAQKVSYGKTETRQSISNVIAAVLNTYLYTSLPEFNAILKGYNVVADRGQEDSRIYKHKGLVYRVLDPDGNKIGVPIKASSISGKPTLDKFEKIFEKNKVLKEPFRLALKKTVDEVLAQHPQNLPALIRLLNQKNISTVLRQNASSIIYGITFIDHNNKTVFNGSDLGKGYSAAHLQEKLATNEAHPAKETVQPDNLGLEQEQTPDQNMLDLLLTQREQFDYVPGQLLKKKRKRKRKSLGL